MKRFLSIIILSIFVFLFTACVGEQENTSRSNEVTSTADSNTNSAVSSSDKANTAEVSRKSKNETDKKDGNNINKILVAYFSATGNTKSLAEYAADILDADLYEIVPKQPYTDEDLAYYTGGRADNEQNDKSARPAISGSVQNMEQYNTIILGYPIWHGEAPRIMETLI